MRALEPLNDMGVAGAFFYVLEGMPIEQHDKEIFK